MTTTTPITSKHPSGGAPRIHPDARRTRLRTLLSAVDREFATLTADGAKAAGEGAALRGALKDLTAALDLGVEPVIRLCPGCGAIAFEAASRCSECWVALKPQ
ncbi:MAG: hypothetical protein K8W52_02490 [Deltaproteobacteria bacterium]|nr:hypothetical protein [Deltaproteobacteria bacterium]